jgi:hypothetical protein
VAADIYGSTYGTSSVIMDRQEECFTFRKHSLHILLDKLDPNKSVETVMLLATVSNFASNPDYTETLSLGFLSVPPRRYRIICADFSTTVGYSNSPFKY